MISLCGEIDQRLAANGGPDVPALTEGDVVTLVAGGRHVRLVPIDVRAYVSQYAGRR